MARGRAPMELEDYLGKEPTDLQARFATWLTDTVGYDASKAKTKQEAFEEGVRLATATRMVFQRSDENQEVLTERRSEIEAEKAEKVNKTKKRVNGKAKPKAEAETDEEEEEEEEEQPKRRATAKKATPAKKAAAKKAAPKKRATKAAASEDESDDEDEVPF